MKWSIFVCLLACLAKYSEGGALRCPPGVSDSSCTEEKNEVGTQDEINLDTPVIVAPIENDSGEDNFLEIIYMMKLTTICKPNNEFMKDCNPCKCSADGLSYTCTRNECMEVDKEVDKEVEVFMESEGADHIERHSVCRARETFNISCNSCRCNSLGTDYSCTNKFCPLPPDVEVFGRQDIKPATPYTGDDDLEDLRVTKKECRPDEVFELDCNTCRCNPDGKSYSCTRRACSDPEDKQKVTLPGKVPFFAMERKAKVCIPDEWFRRDCDWCLCDPTGLVYSCERKGCSFIDDRTNLPPILSADINESKGKLELVEKSNTEKRSSKHLDTPVVVAPITRSLPNATKAQVCVANRMFVLDCNTCWCNEDGTSYVCTRRTCVPLLPDEEPDLGGIPAEDLRVTKKECRPDEVFELDCNTCRCNPDGKSYSCTRRACEDPGDKQKVTLSRKVRSFPMDEMPKAKACQPGQEFRMDCNTCLCDNQGLDFSCTRNDCNAVNNNHEVRRKREVSDPIEMKCSPGSVFNQDCNVCKCSEDGNHATCTIKQCKPKNEPESEVRLAESDPDFRCTAGEQFKRDCNDCTCQADGKDVYCTVRYCD